MDVRADFADDAAMERLHLGMPCAPPSAMRSIRRWAWIAVAGAVWTGCSEPDTPICGDGKIESSEACDVGPAAEAGCDACVIAAGWRCEGTPSACSEVCGDALVVGEETCDDGDDAPGDGCAACTVEPGWTCTGASCVPLCGDGRIVSDEACDDRDTGDGDGCDATCRIESGYSCSGEPSICVPDCTSKISCSGLDCGEVDDGCGQTIACGPCTGWFEVHDFGDPSPRRLAHAFWTGSDVVLFGGYVPAGWVPEIWRYDPTRDRWAETAPVDAPPGYGTYTAVFTGAMIILWGGSDESGLVNTGWRFDLAEERWTRSSTIGAPSPRVLHVAAWTGTEMFVFGGEDGLTGLEDGGLYDPVSDTWRPVPTATSAPDARRVLWTGSELYVEGAFGPPMMFRPSDGRWRQIAVPPHRDGLAGPIVWTGSEVFSFTSRGAESYAQLYDPAADRWREASRDGIASPRTSYSAVWTGSEVILWGGRAPSDERLGDGFRYDPVLDAWRPVEMEGAPSPRYGHAWTWTDRGMFVWGGQGPTYRGDGALYVPD